MTQKERKERAVRVLDNTVKDLEYYRNEKNESQEKFYTGRISGMASMSYIMDDITKKQYDAYLDIAYNLEVK